MSTCLDTLVFFVNDLDSISNLDQIESWDKSCLIFFTLFYLDSNEITFLIVNKKGHKIALSILITNSLTYNKININILIYF